MTSKEIQCPVCNQSDRVEKVSTIYLVGIGLKREPADPDSAAIPFKLADLPGAQLRNLAQALKPPSSTRRIPTRPLHPDLVVITFSLMVPIFVYGILASQPPQILPVLAFLAVVYGVYFWKRKAIVNRFESRQSRQRAADELARRGIERWMKMYFCARDQGVFEPGRTELIPAEQVASLWQSPE